MKPRIALGLLATLLIAPTAAAGPVDLSSWSVVQYEFFDQPDANWVLSGGNTIATQTVNADASILLSDFDITDTSINGTWRVNTNSDDDFMGFVFGYKDRGDYYLFDWKKADQSSLGFAQRGMSIKVVHTGGSDPTGNDLWPTAGSPNVTTLFHNTTPWASFTDYGFHLEFHPGTFTIQVTQGATVLLSQTILDSTYTSGKFGFYNYSQSDVQYSGFTRDPAPGTDVPEPTSIGVLSVALLVGWRARCSRMTG